MKLLGNLIIILLILLTVAVIGAWQVFSPVEKADKPVIFTVPEKKTGFDLVKQLADQKLIKNPKAFTLAFNFLGIEKNIVSGGFRLNQNMNAFRILKKLTGKPDLVWVIIPEGLRKEQIGEILSSKLNWRDDNLQKWNEEDTTEKPEYFEGVYFPDTYLIPVNETGKQIAQRMTVQFNEKTADLLPQFAEKDILWTTGVKIASLIQREAAGPEDMKLISGIIWNRLIKDMKLEIDATLQYLQENPSTSSGQNKWWGKVDIASKKTDSPYNLYLNKGLPPHPICNPGLSAIEAALNPEETRCLYYLHDHDRQIHCSATYEEHKENIKKYLL